MAWTAPRTWVTSEVVTAAIMNTHVRDNLLETGPAIVTAGAGRMLVSNGTNSLVQRFPQFANVDTSQTTTSTSYTDLTTTGPTISGATTGARVLVMVAAQVSNDTAGEKCWMGVDVSGASTVAPSDARAFMYESSVANDESQAAFFWFYTGLTGGANTFQAKYRVTANTGTFARRKLMIIPYD